MEAINSLSLRNTDIYLAVKVIKKTDQVYIAFLKQVHHAV
jgi:hypothetical protein